MALLEGEELPLKKSFSPLHVNVEFEITADMAHRWRTKEERAPGECLCVGAGPDSPAQVRGKERRPNVVEGVGLARSL